MGVLITAGLILGATSCDSGNLILTASANNTTPNSYHWSNGDTTRTAHYTATAGAVYAITITDVYGCMASDTIPITIDIPGVTISERTGSGCIGASATAHAHGYGTLSYNWSNGSDMDSITSLATGTYYLTVTDNLHCTVKDSVVISSSALNITIDSTNVLCNGGSTGKAIAIVTGGSGTITFSWSNGGSTDSITGLLPGEYTVTAIDAGGCSAVASVNITEPGFLYTSGSVYYPDNCNASDSGTFFTATGGGTYPYHYLWSNGDTTQNLNARDGLYYVTITDNNGCEIDSLYGLSHSPIVINLLSITPACRDTNGAIAIIATGGNGYSSQYTYIWSNADTANPVGGQEDSIFHLLSSPGYYSVTVSQSSGGFDGLPSWTCNAVDTFSVDTFPTVSITGPNIVDTCLGASIVLSVTTTISGPGYVWSVSNDSTRSSLSVNAPGNYKVTVTNGGGCTATASDSITAPPGSYCCLNNPLGTVIPILKDTLSSQLSIPAGSEVYVAPGVVITVNNNWTLTNCEFVLGAGAEIIIDDTLELIGTSLHGCDTMWNGIIQAGGAFITNKYGTKRSRVQDAMAALTNNAAGYADHIRYTDFFRNQKNLGFELYDAPDLDISACTFGMGGYTNMLPVTHGNTATNRPSYGIYIVYTGDVAIPNPTYSGVADTFQNMNSGIVTLGSFVNVYSNVFDSIYDYENSGLPNGSAVLATGYTAFGDPSAYGGLLVQTRTTVPDTGSAPMFKNCNIAVSVYAQSATVTNNRMENVIYGVYSNSCQAASTITVEENYINNTAFGVSLINNSSATQLVDYNTIYVYPVVEHYGYNGMGWVYINGDEFYDSTYAHIYAKTYGVEETEITSSATTIKHNTIYRGLNCIELNNTVNTEIADNYLHLANDSAVKGNQAGLYAANCHNLLVSKDTVDGDGATYLGAPDTLSLVVTRDRKAGISLYNTYTGNLCNNLLAGTTSAKGLGYGMLYAGNCNGVQLYSNTMQASGYGLTLLSSGTGTVIYNQGGFNINYQNNDFPGPFTYTDGTYSYIHVDSVHYQAPTFYYLSGQSSTYTPANSSNLLAEEIKFLSEPKDSTEFCERITLPGPQGGNGFARALAIDSGQYYMVPGIDSIAANWLAEKTLYESLYGDTAVLNHDTVMANFYARIDSSDMGAILRSELQNQLLTDSATLADSTSSGGKPSGYSDALSSAEYLNNIIPTTNIQAANYQAMSKIYLQMRVAGIDTFTSGQMDTIKRLAIQCPYLAGDAVYMARSLYSQIDNTVFFNDLNICQPLPDGSYRSLEIPSSGDTAIVTHTTPLEFVHLYPNPAKNIINLNFYAQTIGGVQFELMDALGQTVIKQFLGGRTSVQFSTGSLSNGLYYWQLSDSKRTIQIGKVAIMK